MTAIENIFTTEDELYKAVSDSLREDNVKPATKELLRYREALWEGYKLILANGKIDMACVVSTFRQVKNSTAGLRSPQSLTVIRRGQSEFRSGEIVYTPSRGEGILESKI